MHQVIMDTSALHLPQEFAEKIGTAKVVISEVNGGVLLTPIQRKSSNLRGMLKGTGFSTERYFQQNQADKELEG